MNGRFLWAALVTAIATSILGTTAILNALLHGPRRVMDWVSATWARLIINAAGIQVEMLGLENLPEGSAIIAANHQGVFDILALIAFLPRPPVFVTKQEAFKVPIFGPALTALGHIPVDRKNTQKAIESIQAGAKRLRQHNDKVVFFPEGTRTRDGHLQAFKKGAFVFAFEAQMPVVPVAVAGVYEALPPKKRKIQRGTIRLQFLPALSPADYADKEALLNVTRTQIENHLTTLYQLPDLPGGPRQYKHTELSA